jgi:hypothetical protein
MRSVPLNPPVADTAPNGPAITRYDEQHYTTYLRLLDAEAAAADWKDVARAVLHLDPAADEPRAKQTWQSHLDRAKWLSEHGYRDLLHGGRSK